MANVAPEFETTDTLGKTLQYASTVGTTAVQVPPSATTSIDSILIRCQSDNSPVTKRLLWSIDNVTYHTLAPGEFIGWTMKKDSGGTEIKQIYLKGSAAAVSYEVLVNLEEN